MRAAIAWSINRFYYTVGGGSSPLSVSASTVCRISSVDSGSDHHGTGRPGRTSRFVPSREWKERRERRALVRRRYVQSLHRPRRFARHADAGRRVYRRVGQRRLSRRASISPGDEHGTRRGARGRVP